MVQQYLQQVGMKVLSQGKPTNGDFVGTLTERAQAAVREIVPANYRLAVRVALRKYAKQINQAVKAI